MFGWQFWYGQVFDGFDGLVGGQVFDFGIWVYVFYGDYVVVWCQQMVGQIYEIYQFGKCV